MLSDGAGMLAVVIVFVTCSGATRGSAILRQILPGLEVLMQALTTANVNIVLDLVQDNCPEPLAIKRKLKRRLTYEYRCDERLKTKNEESIHLTGTGLVVELEHLKTKTR